MIGRVEYDCGQGGDHYDKVDRWERRWEMVEVCSDGRYRICGDVVFRGR